MASFEDSYKSQLQGVSQQVARERIDGQVSVQDNMLSDAVTNLRRRPGAMFAYNLSVPNGTDESILAWDTDLAGQQCVVILNCVDGVIRILNSKTYALLATLPTSAYLTTVEPRNIQVATVGDEFFLVNTEKKPEVVPGTQLDPKLRGFFYVRSGAFSKAYEVKVQSSLGSVTAALTTPSGSNAGDAAASTPESIASNLVTTINNATATTGVTAYRDYAYVYLLCTTAGATNLAVSTPSGSAYVIASGQSYLRQESELPSRLPAEANGYVISAGELRTPRYYKYDSAKLAWLETGDAAAPAGITNVPVSVTLLAGVWTLRSMDFEGKFAGDADSNPDPDFVRRGITGMSSYQGRLVLLAGSMANLSASNKPRRFYRSTVVTLLDSDCISVGASAASSAAYQYAVPFYKDLLLFSEKYQAVIPGGNQALSPRTASVLVTSTYDADMTTKPVPVGRTLMYSAPRSKDFFGLLEMLPSTTTDAHYTSYDSTAHIPKYMPGRCRFGVSSSVANMVLFAPTGDRRSLIVHEYTWQEDKKIQQSWHRWTFRYPIAAAYFAGQTVYILFMKNGQLVACTIDPRSGVLTSDAERRPFLDMSVFVDVVNNTVGYPQWIKDFDPTALADLKLSVASGDLAGEPVGFTTDGTTMTTVRSFPNGRVAIGFPFRSAFSPTPPMVKDSNQVKISSNKLTILRFMIGTNHSMEYEVTVTDNMTLDAADGTGAVGTLYFSSSELELGQSRVGADSIAAVPCRTAADSTSLLMYTEGMGEMNLVSLEFVARYHEKIKRAKAT